MKYQRKIQVFEAFQFPGEIPNTIEASDRSVHLNCKGGLKVKLWPGCYVIGTAPGGQEVMSKDEFESKFVRVVEVPLKKKAATTKKTATVTDIKKAKPSKKKTTRKKTTTKK